MASIAIEITYEEVEDMIYEACWRFFNKYKGDWHEWLSEANYIFMVAYYSYNEELGASFSTYLRYLLDRRLVDRVRKAIREQRYHDKSLTKKTIAGTGCKMVTKHALPVLDKLRGSISKDAFDMARLIIEMPTDLRFAIMCRPDYESRPKKARKAVCELLTDFGWSAEKISESFKEIREALC